MLQSRAFSWFERVLALSPSNASFARTIELIVFKGRERSVLKKTTLHLFIAENLFDRPDVASGKFLILLQWFLTALNLGLFVEVVTVIKLFKIIKGYNIYSKMSTSVSEMPLLYFPVWIKALGSYSYWSSNLGGENYYSEFQLYA